MKLPYVIDNQTNRMADLLRDILGKSYPEKIHDGKWGAIDYTRRQ